MKELSEIEDGTFEPFNDLLEQFEEMLNEVFQGSRESEFQIPSRVGEELDRCRDMSDILGAVKTSVLNTLGETRSDIVLGFQDLPLQVGAYHPVGSEWIVMNRRLLNAAWNHLGAGKEMNSYIFSIMLHEYLHSLGYLNEYQVRQLVYEISRQTFGDDHPATRFARYGPWKSLSNSAN